jgi:NAD(P)-dependent dehydrogenase (short-subunit alcohol dehydrogenase family)
VGLLDGRVVMVSGVGPGLGRATAAAALREGARVVLGDLDTARLETICHELDPDGDRAIATGLDITGDRDCAAIADTARERFGRLDGVVHVATLDTVEGGLLEGGFDDWDRAADRPSVFWRRQSTHVVLQRRRNGRGFPVERLIG